VVLYIPRRGSTERFRTDRYSWWFGRPTLTRRVIIIIQRRGSTDYRAPDPAEVRRGGSSFWFGRASSA
jgi:hypothetical protein